MASMLPYFRVLCQTELRASIGFRWLSKQPRVLAKRPRVQAQGKGFRSVLKGTGNPMVMRRLVNSHEDDDDADDDFLVDAAKQPEAQTSSDAQKSKRRPAKDPTQPENTRIHSAEYISSCTSLQRCPQDGLPEFAIIGRSNVGKSSLINMLTRSKNLALTSKQPGDIQFYLRNPPCNCAVLPALQSLTGLGCGVQARPGA
jgi:hypothetical protein